MEPSPTPEESATRIRVSEALRTAAPTPAPGDGNGLEIAFYPDRIARPPDPLELSPSRALRFTDDPGRMAAAAQTAGSRTTVTSPTPSCHPRTGESDLTPDGPSAGSRPVQPGEPDEADIPRAADAPGMAEAPEFGDVHDVAGGAEIPEAPEVAEAAAQSADTLPAAEAAGTVPSLASSRAWSVPLEDAPPARHVPWWRRLLGLGGRTR